VRTLVGVLNLDRNASKDVITTTASFAPGILADKDIAALVPHRLDLIDGRRFRENRINLRDSRNVL